MVGFSASLRRHAAILSIVAAIVLCSGQALPGRCIDRVAAPPAVADCRSLCDGAQADRPATQAGEDDASLPPAPLVACVWAMAGSTDATTPAALSSLARIARGDGGVDRPCGDAVLFAQMLLAGGGGTPPGGSRGSLAALASARPLFLTLGILRR